MIRSPAGGQWNSEEGLVGTEFPVKLHKMFLLPLYQPGEVSVPHLDLKQCRKRLDTRPAIRDSSPKNETSVIISSLSCRSKPKCFLEHSA